MYPAIAVLERGQQPAIMSLLDADFTIGRHPNNTLQVPQGTMIRFHARIEKEGDAFIVRDLGGSMGTWLNRVQISSAALRHGDLISFRGRCRLQFLEYDDALALETARQFLDDLREHLELLFQQHSSADGPVIKGCDWKWRFCCPLLWRRLPGDAGMIRHCSVCKEAVVRCVGDEEEQACLEQDQRVAR